MSESFWDTIDNAIEQGFASLDPKDEEYLHKLNALTNALGKVNDATKNSNDAARMEQTEQLAKARRRIDVLKIIAEVGAGILAGGIGLWEFISMQNFEQGGGFYTSSAGKGFSKERRKEREKETYYK